MKTKRLDSQEAVWSAALRLLSRRDYTAHELRQALLRRGACIEHLEQAIRRAEELGFIADRRSAFLTAERLAAAGYGELALKERLRRRGVDEALIADALEAARSEAGDELERARALWERKFGAAPEDARAYAKQARFLAARGFGAHVIARLLRDPPQPETDP